jgi:hypothetical protein
MLLKLESIDSTEITAQTKSFCKASVPTTEGKKKVWDGIWAKEFDGLGLLEYR